MAGILQKFIRGAASSGAQSFDRKAQADIIARRDQRLEEIRQRAARGEQAFRTQERKAGEEFNIADREDRQAHELEMGTSGVNTPAGLREFTAKAKMAGMSEEEIAQAVQVDFGLKARAGGGGKKFGTFTGEDGRERPWRADPATGMFEVYDGKKWIDASETGAERPEVFESRPEEDSAQRIAKGKVVGAAEGEREANAPKARAKLKATTRKIDRTIESVDKAIADVSGLTTGAIGAIASSVRGTPAYNLKQAVLTVKANLGFDALQEMRDNSPTGGALGQVAIQELDALQASVASLDIGQSPERVRENLELVKEHYQTYKNAVQAAYEDTYEQGGRQGAGTPNSNQPQRGGPTAGAVEDGYRFKGGDPSRPENWEKI